MNTMVLTTNNINETKEQIDMLLKTGYPNNSIYVLAHDNDRTNRVAKLTNAEKIGLVEEGLGTSIANFFRSRGDELRAKMRSMGISQDEAERLEVELDKDKIVVIAWGGKLYSGDDYDPLITYSVYRDTKQKI